MEFLESDIEMMCYECTQHQDLLQLMIDASVDEGETGGKRTLTDEQIVGNAITFMLAGYETTANALSYTSYLLALHPHVQERLQQEIDSYYEENPVISMMWVCVVSVCCEMVLV